jgi:multidrug efflux pump subunit AcrA (membrane-fusion protein)
MDAATVAAWHAAADPDGPPDRVRIETIVTVPRPGVVQSVGVGPGDVVRPGTPLAEIGAGSEGYVCGVPDPEGQITPSSATLQVDGRAVEVESVMTRLRTRQEPGSVTVVPKNTRVRGSARLGIAAVATDEAVLTAPLSAVRTAPDGRTIVNVVEGDDRRVTTVTLGVSAQGWVEVRGRGLREGDAVELFDEASAAGSATDGAEPTS